MKTLFSLGLLAVLGPVSVQAQIFRPEAIHGAAVGAIAGAIIGNNSGSLGHDGLRGAAWGAGLGLITGQIAGDARAERDWRGTQVPPYRGNGGRYSRGPVYGVDRGPLVWEQQPMTRGDGLVLGAIAGAVIGNNSRIFGHRGDRGAAWGAGIGYILGAIAQDNARVRAVPPPVRVLEAPAATAPTPPQQITIINNYYNAPATAMTPANQLFGRN
jgi:uncharacterized protein YcfJ